MARLKLIDCLQKATTLPKEEKRVLVSNARRKISHGASPTQASKDAVNEHLVAIQDDIKNVLAVLRQQDAALSERNHIPVSLTRPRTIETTGGGKLFAENEIPFNPQGQVDDTAQRQVAIDARNTEIERGNVAEQAQQSLLARRRPDTGTMELPFEAGFPLTVQEGMNGATQDEAALFANNMGLAAKIANSFWSIGDPQDLRQEAFIALTRAARTFDQGKGDFGPYAATVIRNHLRGLYGKELKQIDTESLDELTPEGDRIGDLIPDRNVEMAPDVAEHKESIAILLDVIKNLPDIEKMVVVRRMGGESAADVAESEGRSGQWVYNVEKAAMARIKRHLMERGVTELPRALHARQRIDQAAIDSAREEFEREAIYKPPPFYSKLERTIEQKMPNSAGQDQVKAIVAGGGIKAEEIKWSGVMQAIDRIAQENGGKVPKQALQDYLRADGAVRLEEVKLSALKERIDYHSDYVPPSAAKFSQWQLPGGENYREVVLAMPSFRDKLKWTGDEYWEVQRLGEVMRGDFGQVATPQQVARWDELQSKQKAANAADYTSSHFPDVSNYVAHMRVNDRTDANGEPGVLIEEIQSDRHQQGREKGYVSNHQLPEGWKLMPLVDGPGMDSKFIREVGRGDWWAVFDKEGNNKYTAPTKEEAFKGALSTEGIPDAPFRKDWPVQMFKRALRDAVEQGKRWIGWTTGETQAERYDLSKQVDAIEWSPKMKSIRVEIPNGNYLFIAESTADENNLASYVGKDAARKLMEQSGDELWRRIEGEDLKVGGEGMKGFYDTILPNEIGKYVKQWGARVEKSEVDIRRPEDDAWYETPTDEHFRPIWRVNITPEMAKGVEAGQPLFARSKVTPMPDEARRPPTQEEADEIVNRMARDAEEIGRVIGEQVEKEQLANEHKVRFKDLMAAHVWGRFDKMNYFAEGAGEELLKAGRSAADYAAAVRVFTENLNKKVYEAFGSPSYWRNKENRKRLNSFKNELLPYAAALNPVARDDAGDFVFKDFWQRAGEVSDAQAEKLYGRKPGDEWVEPNGERWRISKEWIIPDPKKPNEGFYQLERYIPAIVQGKFYENFHNLYPEAAFMLDDFIEPGMESERVVSPRGIELPSFNRHSLYGVYGDTPLGLVEKLPGYTPDVARTKSIAGYVAKLLKLDWKSPGRDYKSGQARVTGQVKNLFEGFNVRAAQAHMETMRRRTAERLLKVAMKPVPQAGVPSDFVKLDRDTLNPLIRSLREANKKTQAEMPEIMAETRDQLTERNIETIKFLFGDPELFNEKQMIHKQVLAELHRGFVRLNIDHEFLDGMTRWLRGSVAGMLGDFQTVATNKLGNYLFHQLRFNQRVAYAAAAAMSGEPMEAKRAIREAGFLVKGFFTNFYHPEIRDRMNRLVPPEWFQGQNFTRLMMGEDAEKTPVELLKELNTGGALLKAVGYGEMDDHSKQKLALASLLSRASIAADEAGIKGAGRKIWMYQWIENAPEQARIEAETAAKLYLMDYANVPWWLDEGHKIEIAGSDVTPWVNFARAMIIPFWKYPYNYLRQIKRFTWDSGKALASKDAGKIEKMEAAANLVSLVMLLTTYWLLFKPWGDDEDEILGRDVDEQGNELDPKFKTGSRMRLAGSSAAGMAVNTALRMFGADTGNDDMWVRMRTLPYATQALALGSAIKWLVDPSSGRAKSTVSSAEDMLEDFMSIGTGARMALAGLGYRDQYTRGQSTGFIWGQGAMDLLTGRALPPRAMKDIATLVDPVNRRYTKTESLDYFPGPVEGVMSKIPGVTQFLPPSGRVIASAKSGGKVAEAARIELESMGLGRGYRDRQTTRTNRKTGMKEPVDMAAYVDPERVYEVPSWKAAIRQAGLNVKSVPREEYRKVLAGE